MSPNNKPKRNQGTSGGDTQKIQQLEEKIETLEDITRLLQEKFEKLESQHEALRQLVNDTDTETIITTIRQSKDIHTNQTNITDLQINVTTLQNTKK